MSVELGENNNSILMWAIITTAVCLAMLAGLIILSYNLIKKSYKSKYFTIHVIFLAKIFMLFVLKEL